MNVGSLFSGIGGMDYGLHRAGFEHAFFAESDEWRRGVLAHHWPGVPIYGDVRVVGRGVERGGLRERESYFEDTEPRGARSIDLLCGGFPCQDVSVAGRRAGLAGARSGLFHEFARIIESLRPGWVLVENVPGLLSSNGGRDFGVVVGTLADLGYGVAWRVLDSRFFGVPQRRRRVYVVGTLIGDDPRAAARRAGQVLAIGTRCPGHPPPGTQTGTNTAVASLSGIGNGGLDDNDGQAGRIMSYALNGKRGNRDDGESETFVTHSLTSEGHDASEDGTGRGTPLVAATLSHGSNPNSNAAGRRLEDDFNLVAETVRSHPRPGSNTNGNLVTAFHQTQEPIHGDDFSPAIGASSIGMGVGINAGVRRLTPRECERLQALPDDWTAHGADSRRYAVTSSVAEWIGRRIIASHPPPLL